MPRFLITLSLGPVQSLIADARRTRDLWCGSWLLSEAARAAARALHERHPGCLIFPSPDNPDEDLKPQDTPREAANTANILRAEAPLSDRTEVLVLCDEAKRAAALRVQNLGERARRLLGVPVREEVWRTQVDDILECFAAWVEIADGDDGYPAAGQRLGAALNARKATRNFQPCRPLTGPGLPKSSLDGARETVLPHWPAEEPARLKLRLSPGEQLDALGVIKRLAGDAKQFTALPRIAADSWIERLTSDQQQRLQEAYEPLVEAGHATRVRGNADTYAALPFDGHLLYPSRRENALAHAREQHANRAGSTAFQAIEAFQQCVTEISRERTVGGQPVGTPVPYAAILKADGDRMGQLLSRAQTAEESRDISRALHRFASNVRRVVRDHRGHAIYAGGDDVLALLSLERTQDCARALAKAFSEHLNGIAKRMRLADDECPTLSVGLGIGYVIEPLGALRALADRAEQHAKGDAAQTRTRRNALAILLKIRSGAELHWRAQWTDTQAFEALDRFTAAYRTGELPTRAAYDLRDIDQRLAWLHHGDDETARGMRKAEVERMLDRARRDGGGKKIPLELRDMIRNRADGQPLYELADTLIIARWLAARTASDLGE